MAYITWYDVVALCEAGTGALAGAGLGLVSGLVVALEPLLRVLSSGEGTSAARGTLAVSVGDFAGDAGGAEVLALASAETPALAARIGCSTRIMPLRAAVTDSRTLGAKSFSENRLGRINSSTLKEHGWPSGQRRQTQVLVGESPRGFKSHFVQSFARTPEPPSWPADINAKSSRRYLVKRRDVDVEGEQREAKKRERVEAELLVPNAAVLNQVEVKELGGVRRGRKVAKGLHGRSGWLRRSDGGSSCGRCASALPQRVPGAGAAAGGGRDVHRGATRVAQGTHHAFGFHECVLQKSGDVKLEAVVDVGAAGGLQVERIHVGHEATRKGAEDAVGTQHLDLLNQDQQHLPEGREVEGRTVGEAAEQQDEVLAVERLEDLDVVEPGVDLLRHKGLGEGARGGPEVEDLHEAAQVGVVLQVLLAEGDADVADEAGGLEGVEDVEQRHDGVAADGRDAILRGHQNALAAFAYGGLVGGPASDEAGQGHVRPEAAAVQGLVDVALQYGGGHLGEAGGLGEVLAQCIGRADGELLGLEVLVRLG
ncbi:Asp23/Gls24 family envelope stress response protein [Babesia caballi]|uniref:Asp23/Gls24 family envelope stress response protein n=1 Tax=Babesia caballi TaxID=5871 RepID=A0AAV4LYN0_BABCB|nr:Asp23/Gls24 family envelope stress response protein [Babesia caballi]